jgi:Cu+-exporting ATPase
MFKTLIAFIALPAVVIVGAGWMAYSNSSHSSNGCIFSSNSTSQNGSCCAMMVTPSCCEGTSCCEGESSCAKPGASACCSKSEAQLISADTAASATSTEAKTQTTMITVEDLDCPSCAKKITAKLILVDGVEKASADIEKSCMIVTAKDKAKPSAKAMWAAVEKAGFKPTKLEGPAGKFTEAPKE